MTKKPLSYYLPTRKAPLADRVMNVVVRATLVLSVLGVVAALLAGVRS